MSKAGARGQDSDSDHLDADLRERLTAMEIKVRKMRDTRGNLNDSAHRSADQRNAMQKRYKEHRELLDEKLAERKAVRDLIAQHKARRNSIQQQMKDLFGRQKSNRDDEKGGRSAAGEYSRLISEISTLEVLMETSGRVSLVKEKEYLNDIKNMRRRIKELEPEVEQFEIVKVDLTDVDAAIATLKAEADISHQAMLEQVEIADGMKAGLDEMFSERDFLKAEGDRLHEEFVSEKEKANAVHEKIADLMSQVTEIRGELEAQRKERKSWMTEHNAAVAAEMKTGAEDDGVADQLVSELLATGELSMGGTLASDPSGRFGDSEGDSQAVRVGRDGSGRKKKKKGTTFSASPSNPGKK
ncbi:MAG: hypothetical protein CXX80_08815 [Methanobacteriota archaeon]|nr:MAG: hypothetical protein CXX80_08815 [Euryarchaeota archaeon]